MQWLSVANMDKSVGTVTYTQLCNELGGIECDLTMVRTSADSWYVVTGSAFGSHDMGWIRANPPSDGSVIIRDLTSARAVINMCGPLSREVLQAVCEDDIQQRRIPLRTSPQITIGAAPVLAMRIGYVGELGWELHIPTEYAAHVYELLQSCRSTSRHHRRWLPHDRHDADGEGVPLLVDRHHPGHLAVGGRFRLAGRSE